MFLTKETDSKRLYNSKFTKSETCKNSEDSEKPVAVRTYKRGRDKLTSV